ncbi:Cordon-bleu protein-like 1 [Frankliniella fusca]|uniref:Cordon-bleu protein-like 1 n=1 Tax=Frankliniella fusca TaxID=407009 RepID=A0AAE1H1D8_9NEOP|nr:Cordon-bleu protein-like 1 [Frankliniella fusca]
MAMAKVSGVPLAEDAPPDLLAGSMDLRVVLPCGSVARCNVDRSTPMMDLLVQLAKVHRISPAAHTLQPFGIKNTPLQSQPSTPIGALDVFTVKIVPKARPLAPLGKRTAPRPTPAQPFEQTFRLQVHLPRNQLYVTRASRATVLGDIRHLACTEKNLDPLKYELRHPANLDQRLDPDATLGECGLTEVALVAAGGRLGLGLSQPLPDIMALRRQEDRRREAAKAGQFGYLTSHSMAEGSVSSASSGSLGGRSTSPAPSDGERSTSPPAIQPLQQLQPPSRPGRKRRPAPKPPVSAQPSAPAPAPAPATTTPAPAPAPAANTTTEMNNNINKEVIASGGTVISHSRNSSDSSGYHEASVLSESPEGLGLGQHDGLPGLQQDARQQRPRAAKQLQSCVSQPNLNLSRSMTNLSVQQQQLSVRGNRNSIAVSGQGHLGEHDVHDGGLGRVPGAHRASTSSLATAGQRKKKAPPPPPPAAAPQPRPAADGLAAPASAPASAPAPASAAAPAAPTPAPSSGAPADPFLKTQSLERQSSVQQQVAEDAASSLRPGLTKSCTLPSSLSSALDGALGADAVPAVGSSSSSSTPTPTPSEQSVHLSGKRSPSEPRPASSSSSSSSSGSSGSPNISTARGRFMKTMVNDGEGGGAGAGGGGLARPSYLSLGKPLHGAGAVLRGPRPGGFPEAVSASPSSSTATPGSASTPPSEQDEEGSVGPAGTSPAQAPAPPLPSPQICLLEPPPPDVMRVSRRESSDSWHNFLVELNRILQDRVGEYV